MEAGPAALFSADELKLEPEPALADGSDRIDVEGLARVEGDFARLESTLTEAERFLSSVAEDLKIHIDAVGVAIDSELTGLAPQVPQDILDNMQPAQDAIDGAESSFISEAYEENAPWYRPASDEIPDEPPPSND